MKTSTKTIFWHLSLDENWPERNRRNAESKKPDTKEYLLLYNSTYVSYKKGKSSVLLLVRIVVTFEGRMLVVTGRGFLWFWGSVTPSEYRVPTWVRSLCKTSSHTFIGYPILKLYLNKKSQVKTKKRRNEMEGKRSQHCIGMMEGGAKSKMR